MRVEWLVGVGRERELGQLVVRDGLADRGVGLGVGVDVATVAGPLALAGAVWKCSAGCVAEVMSWQTSTMS